jgi:hypothetical protein
MYGWEEMNASVKWGIWRKSGESYFWESEKNGASIEQMGVHFKNGPRRGSAAENLKVDGCE